MGLDIYAGSLTRYLSGTWKTQAESHAARSGFGISVLRRGGAQAKGDIALIPSRKSARRIYMVGRPRFTLSYDESGVGLDRSPTAICCGSRIYLHVAIPGQV